MEFEVTLRIAVGADFDAAAALGDAVKKAGYEFIEQHWTVSGVPLPDAGGNFDIQIAPLDEDAKTGCGQATEPLPRVRHA
jgi:hypothetical protein